MTVDRIRTTWTMGPWGPALALAVAFAGALAQLLPGEPVPSATLAGFRWITYANTALVGAAAVYFFYYIWLRLEPVGQAASLLAALGAVGVPFGLWADAAQAPALSGETGGIGLYEGTALFSAAAVLLYLAMERVYRSRATAVFIMPAVVLAVLCEIWLVAQASAPPGRAAQVIAGSWEAGQRFAAYLGHGALAAAAGCGAWVLMRQVHDDAALQRQANAIVGAAAVGAPLLLVGMCMDAAWSITRESEVALAHAGVTVPALAAVLVLLAWARWRSPSVQRLAWHAVAAFAVSTTGLLVAAWPAETLG